MRTDLLLELSIRALEAAAAAAEDAVEVVGDRLD